MPTVIPPTAENSLAYSALYFGMSDSRNEVAEDPERFRRSFVDLNGAIGAITSGRKFLLLGPKGTGKSALAWFLEDGSSEARHLAAVRDASTLPLAEVPRLQTGQSAGPERTVTAWTFILLCNYLELLLRDQSCAFQDQREVQRVAKLLRGYGFMDDTSGRALLKASTTEISIPIPKLGKIYSRESKPQLNIFNLIPYLEDWVSSAQSRLRHILLLDGLDSIFLNDAQYDESLASLVQAAYLLNQKLTHASATGSIVLLLRNDVFSRVSLYLPDSQKMRDDLSFELDWRILSGPGGVNAPLMQLVNAKASHAANGVFVDTLAYFPRAIKVGTGKRSREIATFKYLLNMTRHTPRDLLRLFEDIRRVEASGVYPSDDMLLSQGAIREGVLQYATKYFTGAIQNEFVGFAHGPEGVAAALQAMKAMGSQYFTAEEFREKLAEVAPRVQIEPNDLLRLLFFAGAIGNSVANYDERYMQFYHRRDDAEIYLSGTFVLHNALIHAWGMSRSHRSAPGASSNPSRSNQPPRRRMRNGIPRGRI